MIDLLIYHLHLVGVIYAFTKRWQIEGLKAGLLAIALCGLVFVILWSLMGPIARLVMPVPGQPGDLFTSDTLSLVLTFSVEVPFFWIFFLRSGFGANT